MMRALCGTALLVLAAGCGVPPEEFGAESAGPALAELSQARHERSLRGALRAEQTLSRHLAFAASDVDTSGLRYHYADLLWDLGAREQAAAHYRLAVTQDAAAAPAERAAHRVIAARSDHWYRGPERDSLDQEVEALDFYLSYFSTRPSATAVRYRKAWTFHRFEQFGMAASMFEDLIRTQPSAEASPATAAMLLDSLGENGEHDALAAWARVFRQNPKLMASDNGWLREQVRVALNEPPPPELPTPRRRRKAPDVIPGPPNDPPFLPETAEVREEWQRRFSTE